MSEPTAPAGTAPARSGARAGLSPTVGRVVALIGAVVIVLSAFLDWTKDWNRKLRAPQVGETPEKNAFDQPAQFLFDWKDLDEGGISVGQLAILVAVIVVVGALVFSVRWLPLLGAAMGGLVGLLFLFQVHNFIVDRDANLPLELGDVAGIGPYIMVVGSGIAFVGGVLTLFARRTATTSPTERPASTAAT